MVAALRALSNCRNSCRTRASLTGLLKPRWWLSQSTGFHLVELLSPTECWTEEPCLTAGLSVDWELPWLNCGIQDDGDLGLWGSVCPHDFLQVRHTPVCPGSCRAAWLPNVEGTQAGCAVGNPSLWCPLHTWLSCQLQDGSGSWVSV